MTNDQLLALFAINHALDVGPTMFLADVVEEVAAAAERPASEIIAFALHNAEFAEHLVLILDNAYHRYQQRLN